ncbi:hypothetical protein M413DRAFT_449422 [Hebeloma cylindrosporum]|uniref:Uncharacterized protein n=1 Tax=Hebeloma cylindrosporum TaxID=76867 RepID=A0A0C3BHE2_HEBCY|nr:hypothetical protein M413DRAFT_449422 [Hebeloma cylindrosporum h7]
MLYHNQTDGCRDALHDLYEQWENMYKDAVCFWGNMRLHAIAFKDIGTDGKHEKKTARSRPEASRQCKMCM